MWHPVGYCDVDNMFVPTIMSVWLRYTTDYDKTKQIYKFFGEYFMKNVAMIPARLGSKRVQNKILD